MDSTHQRLYCLQVIKDCNEHKEQEHVEKVFLSEEGGQIESLNEL